MTRPDDYATNVRIGHEAGRRGDRVALLGLVLVLLAVVKPWGSSPIVGEPTGDRSSRPIPTLRTAIGDEPCTGRGWLIAVDKRLADRVVRSWVMADAVIASGPTDPRIRFVTVTSAQVLALGYCPGERDAADSYSRLTIYRLGSTVAVVTATPVTDQKPERASASVLFRPAGAGAATGSPGASPVLPSWEAGKYALQVDGPDGHERWIGLEVEIVAQAGAG